jgi:hypothetical protein
MFLIENTALDEPIGANAVGQERVVNADLQEPERQTLSSTSCTKDQAKQQVQLTSCPIGEDFEKPPVQLGQPATSNRVSSRQQELSDGPQTRLTTFQSGWTEPKSSNDLQLTTPAGQVYNSPETA